MLIESVSQETGASGVRWSLLHQVWGSQLGLLKSWVLDSTEGSELRGLIPGMG